MCPNSRAYGRPERAARGQGVRGRIVTSGPVVESQVPGVSPSLAVWPWASCCYSVTSLPFCKAGILAPASGAASWRYGEHSEGMSLAKMRRWPRAHYAAAAGSVTITVTIAMRLWLCVPSLQNWGPEEQKHAISWVILGRHNSDEEESLC